MYEKPRSERLDRLSDPEIRTVPSYVFCVGRGGDRACSMSRPDRSTRRQVQLDWNGELSNKPDPQISRMHAD